MSRLHDPLDPPCPCGSARHLRQCCALASGPDESDADTEPLITRLIRFGDRGEFASARRRLNRSLLCELTPAQAEAMESFRQQEMQAAVLCFLHLDLPLTQGKSLGTLLLQREGDSLPIPQRSALANMVACPSSLYEIVDVFPGKGLELRDLLRQFTVRVRERSASTMVEPGWLLLTRVRRQPDGTPVLDMPLLHFDQHLRPAADAWLARQRAVGAGVRIEPSAVLAELYRIWQSAMAAELTRPAPRVELRNHSGEALELCEAELRCDRRRLGDWLAQAPDWVADGDDEDDETSDDVGAGPRSWTWIEETPDGHRISLGRLEITGSRCLLHVNSRARLDRAVAILKEAADAVVLDIEATSAGELMARAKSSKTPRRDAESEVPASVQSAILQRSMDAHYRKWIDQPVPIFGGRSPRVMATVDPAAVVRAIWQICNGPPGARYDASWMFAELGLEAPGQGEFTPGLVAE